MDNRNISTFSVEDVFDIKGRGIVVTGRVLTGEIRKGMKSTIFDKEIQVVGTEAFKKVLEVAKQGEYVGLLLSGPIVKGDFKPLMVLKFN